MSDDNIKQLIDVMSLLRLETNERELISWMETNSILEKDLATTIQLLEKMQQKKRKTTIQTLLRLSRLPLKVPKTFNNFEFSRFNGKDAIELRQLSNLLALRNHQNIALIGPPGTGKTHLAQAIGCELREKFNAARDKRQTDKAIRALVRPSCLIIDEIGHCEFDQKNSQLFFDLIDRRYHKDGYFNTVFTSNFEPSQWRNSFNEDNALLCALDRIFDNAKVFVLRGGSFRGQNLEKYTVQVSTVEQD
mgnify:CR=1 FL=1